MLPTSRVSISAGRAPPGWTSNQRTSTSEYLPENMGKKTSANFRCSHRPERPYGPAARLSGQSRPSEGLPRLIIGSRSSISLSMVAILHRKPLCAGSAGSTRPSLVLTGWTGAELSQSRIVSRNLDRAVSCSLSVRGIKHAGHLRWYNSGARSRYCRALLLTPHT